jgi:uncharacterized protein involved in exopolysaccharide biosynthesis
MATTELPQFPSDIVEAPPPPPLIIVGIFEALRRHKLLAILPLVLLTAAGIAVGLRHKPKYTATTQMWVSGFDLTSPGALSGYTDASSSLASTYARLATSQPVAIAAAKRTKLTPSAVQGQVTATPLPSSPIFSVTATTASSQESIVLANATSTALARFVGYTLAQSGPTSTAFTQFRQAEAALNAKQTARDNAQRHASTNTSPGAEAALTTARTQYDVALARVQSLQTEYQGLQASSTSGSGTASVLTPATYSTSDRSSFLQKTAFVGLLAGFVLGIALATLRANLLARRWRKGGWRA